MNSKHPPTPLTVLKSGGMYTAQVIDLAGVKIQRGHDARMRDEKCQHRSLVYCTSDRRVWCQDCNTSVESFDAFMVLVCHFEKMLDAAKADQRKAWDGAQAVIIRRAAKEIDRTWGQKLAPICPHCHRGLLPHDFADRCNAVSIEFESAARARAVEEARLANADMPRWHGPAEPSP